MKVIIDLPKFSKIHTNEILEKLETHLFNCRKEHDDLLNSENYNNFTWENFVLPLDLIKDELNKFFSPIGHLNAVKNNEGLRKVYEKCISLLSKYSTEMGQNHKLFKAYKAVLKNDKNLTSAQIKSLNDSILSFKLSGVDLNESDQKLYKEISLSLSEKQTKFENNLLDSTMDFNFHTNDKKILNGLPNHTIIQALEKAKQNKNKGYLLGLDMPTYFAIMTYADNRDLRETLYKRFCTRASNILDNNPKFDNSKLMEEILNLRDKKSHLLNFKNYAELSLSTKMANSVDDVLKFLTDLLNKSKNQAKKEFDELKSFACSQGFSEELMPWDISYFTEKFKKELFDFTEEDLRDFFPVSQVMSGLFNIIEKTYGYSVVEEFDFDSYHQDVKLFAFYDQSKNLQGKILMDLYARDNKRGGAWMDEVTARYSHSDVLQIPIAYVTCNFTPAVKGSISTITHNDVVTIFHEFGHALHHILTKVNDLPVSGINGVSWDAVELPSQFMENFCWHEKTLNMISKHIKTQKSLSNVQFLKLIESRKFQSGLFMLRQIEFALWDIETHINPNDDTYEILNNIRKETSYVTIPTYNRFLNGFSHVFAGGYAAGYYSYKWAEVLSSDAFLAFEEFGDILSAEKGKQFLEAILEKGGSAKALDLFVNFRKREPKIDALLKHSGIS